MINIRFSNACRYDTIKKQKNQAKEVIIMFYVSEIKRQAPDTIKTNHSKDGLQNS